MRGWLTEVVINGAWTGPLLLDTGASVTLISPAVARAAGVTVGPDTPVGGAGIAGRTRGPIVTLASIQVGEIEARGVRAVVVGPSQGLQGLLGNCFPGPLRSPSIRARSALDAGLDDWRLRRRCDRVCLGARPDGRDARCLALLGWNVALVLVMERGLDPGDFELMLPPAPTSRPRHVRPGAGHAESGTRG